MTQRHQKGKRGSLPRAEAKAEIYVRVGCSPAEVEILDRRCAEAEMSRPEYFRMHAGLYDDEPRKARPEMLPPALFDLVPLSSLPESEWKGRAVFHPCSQVWPSGDVKKPTLEGCEWVSDEYNAPVGIELYDTGVVFRWEPDPDFADLCIIRVWFLCNSGSVLHYGSDNLWTPRPL